MIPIWQSAFLPFEEAVRASANRRMGLSGDKTMSAEQPTNADILQAVQKVSERAVKTETSISYIKWIAIIGFSASIGVSTFLDQKQSSRISRVEARLDANIAALDAKIDRIEDGFAIHRNTACQCEKTE